MCDGYPESCLFSDVGTRTGDKENNTSSIDFIFFNYVIASVECDEILLRALRSSTLMFGGRPDVFMLHCLLRSVYAGGHDFLMTTVLFPSRPVNIQSQPSPDVDLKPQNAATASYIHICKSVCATPQVCIGPTKMCRRP